MHYIQKCHVLQSGAACYHSVSCQQLATHCEMPVFLPVTKHAMYFTTLSINLTQPCSPSLGIQCASCGAVSKKGRCYIIGHICIALPSYTLHIKGGWS